MKTILIVEDSKILAEIIASQVEQQIDCETFIFENAKNSIRPTPFYNFLDELLLH